MYRFGVILVCVLSLGCGSEVLPVAKKSDVDNLAKTVEMVKEALVQTGVNVEKNAAETEKHRKRLDAVESDVRVVKKDLAGKLDTSKLNAGLEAWAQARQFATASQLDLVVSERLGQVQGQFDQLGQQFAAKMDRFQVEKPKASTVVRGATCMYVLDRQTGQWYMWRWQDASPGDTTVLLMFKTRQCPCGKCGEWETLLPTQIQDVIRQVGLPRPLHLLKLPQGGEKEPAVGPGDPVPAPPPPMVSRVADRS